MHPLQRIILGLLFLNSYALLNAQPATYSTRNAHSHNDYQNKHPFSTAYNAAFGSMEADIFLWNDSLIVGHTLQDIPLARTLQSLYLDSLLQKTVQHQGHPYSNPLQSLQLLIDIKTEAIPTLKKLIQVLKTYPGLLQTNTLHFVITGNRPPASSFAEYPSFIEFDAVINQEYPKASLAKIALFSDNLADYIKWDGLTAIHQNEKSKLDSLVHKIHQLGKKIRFWNAPDTLLAWEVFKNAGVDFINTDRINELAAFLNRTH